MMQAKNTEHRLETPPADRDSKSRQAPHSPPASAVLTQEKILRDPPNAPRKRQKRPAQSDADDEEVDAVQNQHDFLCHKLTAAPHRRSSPLLVVDRIDEFDYQEEKKENENSVPFPSHLTMPDDDPFEQTTEEISSSLRSVRLLPRRRKIFALEEQNNGHGLVFQREDEENDDPTYFRRIPSSSSSEGDSFVRRHFL